MHAAQRPLRRAERSVDLRKARLKASRAELFLAKEPREKAAVVATLLKFDRISAFERRFVEFHLICPFRPRRAESSAASSADPRRGGQRRYDAQASSAAYRASCGNPCRRSPSRRAPRTDPRSTDRAKPVEHTRPPATETAQSQLCMSVCRGARWR